MCIVYKDVDKYVNQIVGLTYPQFLENSIVFIYKYIHINNLMFTST